jgi:hypothetical protein
MGLDTEASRCRGFERTPSGGIWRFCSLDSGRHIIARDGGSPSADDTRRPVGPYLGGVDPLDALRSAGRRVTDPVESLAQVVAERVIEIVIQALDLNEIIRQIDLTAVLDQVDVNHVLDRVDVMGLLDRVDLDRLLDQVDVNGLLDRVDVDAVLQRADLDGLLDRVDVNRLVNRIDVDTLVGQTDLGNIIARSTSGFASQGLDVLRAQTVMIDQYTDRLVWRVERRKGARPEGPAEPPHEPGVPIEPGVPNEPGVPAEPGVPHEPGVPARAGALPAEADASHNAGPGHGPVLPAKAAPVAHAPPWPRRHILPRLTRWARRSHRRRQNHLPRPNRPPQPFPTTVAARLPNRHTTLARHSRPQCRLKQTHRSPPGRRTTPGRQRSRGTTLIAGGMAATPTTETRAAGQAAGRG